MADTSYYGSGGGGPPQKKPSMNGLDQGKIFVGGLSWQTTEESLRWHFEQYGPVTSVEVMRDRVTGDPRGFAFVVFKDLATVDLVMAEAKHEINHKIVDVKRAQARGIAPPSIHGAELGPGGKPVRGGSVDGNGSVGGSDAGGGGRRNNFHNNNNNSFNSGGGFQRKNSVNNDDDDGPTPEQMQTKVFVGGLPAHVDRDELRKIFEQFGPVMDSIVMVDQNTNRSRCFGFVTFEAGSDGAQKAVDAQPLQIGPRRVEVKLATPKADQKRMPPTSAGPKHVGLRAGMTSSTSSGEFAGLAVAYGRTGWKAGYGTYAFGPGGWAVWDEGPAPERAGFSFEMLKPPPPPPPTKKPSSSGRNDNKSRDRDRNHNDGPPQKRSRR